MPNPLIDPWNFTTVPYDINQTTVQYVVIIPSDPVFVMLIICTVCLMIIAGNVIRERSIIKTRRSKK